jgi:hypothetical protein
MELVGVPVGPAPVSGERYLLTGILQGISEKSGISTEFTR